MHDTKRRRKPEETAYETNEIDHGKSMDKMKGQYKINNIYLNLRNIKTCVVVVIGLILLYQLWRVWFRPPKMEFTESPEASSWEFKDNPQGLNERSFKELMDTVKTKDCPSYPHKEQKMEFKLPKVEKIYESPGSLKFKGGEFFLDGKPFRILSGAMHYFRVMPEYWEDRMLKMKAMGLNTLETYVSWNLHEDKPGKFNFDSILDVRKYIQLAQKIGLYVIFRPGPYICSEWDFGGLPAWLLRDPEMKVRSNYPGYTEAVDRFFNKLIPMVTDLQHVNGGPIIAVQIENEFGAYSTEVEHLMYLKKLMLTNGVKEMLFTSDGFVQKFHNITGFEIAPFYHEALPTANFKEFSSGKQLFDAIHSISPEFPLVNMEFWSGWFDHWNKPHADSSASKMASDLCNVLKAGASVNFYMLHGGTNFGFMAGANWFKESHYRPDVTSYDYIAPVSEAGDITPKYELAKALIQKHALDSQGSSSLPPVPPNSLKTIYGELVQNEYIKIQPREGKVTIQSFLPLESMLSPVKIVAMKSPVPMEMLSLSDGQGQNYGFTLYRSSITKGSTLKFTKPIQDRVVVLLNGVEIAVLDWFTITWSLDLPQHKMVEENILEILVENCGRVNYVHQGYNRFNEERKGISGDVLLDNNPIQDWDIFPLEFKEEYMRKVSNSHQWRPFANWEASIGMYKGVFVINGDPADSFINMKGWKKGIVVINGFNLGRYWSIGPQKTLYVPAPVLKKGENQVIVFELHKGYNAVSFQETHVLG